MINIFQDGEIFAIPPVLDGKTYPATAISMEKTKLLLIYRNDFLRLVKESDEFSELTMVRMSELLRETTASIKNLATSSPERRIGNVLVRLAKKEKGEPVGSAPKQMCPDCWGFNEWDNQYYEVIKDKHFIPGQDNYESFISKIVEKHVNTTHKHENKYICTTCDKEIVS